MCERVFFSECAMQDAGNSFIISRAGDLHWGSNSRGGALGGRAGSIVVESAPRVPAAGKRI